MANLMADGQLLFKQIFWVQTLKALSWIFPLKTQHVIFHDHDNFSDKVGMGEKVKSYC